MISLEPISIANLSSFKSVRLQALQDSSTAFGSTYDRESRFHESEWRKRTEAYVNGARAGYLAIDAGAPIGIAVGSPDDHDPSVIWLESMWAAPTHRRRGIGRLLVNAVLAWAQNLNISTIKLEVTCNNEPAIGFYQSLGFEMTGNTKPYPNDPALTECEMKRMLL